jgi:6-phosphogluconolactonase/glucosamine-6-phosphate isomerase/deaminase
MDIRVTDDPAEAAAAWIARRLADAVRRRGVASLALSGGSTAPPMIAALIASDLPWNSIAVWQVDERVAPDRHHARNANQLADLPCRVHLMPVTASDLRAAARRYAASLPARLDIVHLGLGDDGHTASWPPGDSATIASQRPVELVEAFNGWPRMTLTRRVVNGARSRLFLVAGSSKRPIVERWLLGDGSLPSTNVSRSATIAFLDASAAPSVRLHRTD